MRSKFFSQTKEQKLISEIKAFIARLSDTPEADITFDIVAQLVELKCTINEKTIANYQLSAA